MEKKKGSDHFRDILNPYGEKPNYGKIGRRRRLSKLNVFFFFHNSVGDHISINCWFMGAPIISWLISCIQPQQSYAFWGTSHGLIEQTATITGDAIGYSRYIWGRKTLRQLCVGTCCSWCLDVNGRTNSKQLSRKTILLDAPVWKTLGKRLVWNALLGTLEMETPASHP